MAAEYIVRLPLEVSPEGDNPPEEQQILLSTEWLLDRIQFRAYFVSDQQNPPNQQPPQDKPALTNFLLLSVLENRAKDFEIPEAEFLDQTKRCLTTNNGLNDFKYVLKRENPSTFQFSWKKCTPKLKLVYGTVQLTVNKESSGGLIESFEKLQEKNRLLQEENEKLKKDHANLQLCFKSLEEAARNTETTILSKCRLLINAKKEKIVELEKQLEEEREKTLTKQPVEEAFSQDSEILAVDGRKRKGVNRIFSQSSQQESSDDSIPLVKLIKRADLLKVKEEKQATEVEENNLEDSQLPRNEEPDLNVAVVGQDSPDCNGLFDDM